MAEELKKRASRTQKLKKEAGEGIITTPKCE
jgi:hypothetical protein